MLNLKTKEDKLGFCLLILGLIYLVIMTYVGVTRLGLIPDEFYSLGLTQLGMNEFLYFAINDVHPIFYYLLYRFLALFFNSDNLIIAGRLLSLLPLYLIFIWIIPKIKKEYGLLAAGLFSLMIASMPELMVYGVMLRMYSWSIFLLLASAMYVMKIIKEPSKKNFIILTVLSIASAYTHYFSAIGSIIIYLLFLGYIIKTNKALFKKWILSTITVILSYIPWILILFFQLQKVKAKYWIEPIGIKSIITYIYYVLTPINHFIGGKETLNPTFMGTVFLVCLIILFSYYICFKRLDSRKAFFYIGVFVLTPVVGIIISILFKPIFHYRYNTCSRLFMARRFYFTFKNVQR